MRRALFLLSWLVAAPTAPAQVVTKVYEPLEGVLRIGPGPERAIPLDERGHTLVLPGGSEPPAGFVVFPEGRRVDPETYLADGDSLHRRAVERGLALIHLSSGNPLDFYFEDAVVRDTVERLQALVEEHGSRDTPLYFCGMSLGGTRALRLAVFLARNEGKYWARPRAVAVVDAPLDMIRFWHAEQRVRAAGFHPAATDEARWVSWLLEEHLGTPRENPGAYVSYSPYTRTAPRGGNARYLRDLAVRAYHEPDVDWWIEHRRKTYYEMNSIDLAALVNELKLAGNERAELVTTHLRRDGQPASSPHTWTIVDDAELVEWFLAQGGPDRAP